MSRRDNMKRIFVGNLPPDVRTRDLEDLFYKYGKIAFIDLKTRRGPPFAFVEFLDYRDAEEAVRHRDGKEFDGHRLRVEFPRGRERVSRFKNGSGSSRSSAPQRRSKYRVKVTGLPTSGSWQDLKDHVREVGEVCFADVFKGGEGVVEFVNYDDMRYAIKKLNNTKFKSHEGESSYIKLTPVSSTPSRSRSRSPVSSRRRGSPTYSPVSKRRDSYTPSRSPSPRSPKPRRGGHQHKRPHKRAARSESRSRSHSRSRSSSNKRTSRSNSPRSRGSSRSASERSRSRSKSNSRTPSPVGSRHDKSSPTRSDGSKKSPSNRHDKSSPTDRHSDRPSQSASRSPHDKASPARSDDRRSGSNSRTPSPEISKD